MVEPKDRLRDAIADYDGPVDAWTKNQRALKAGGIGKDLMVSNCNGNRAISKKAAETYAKVFGRSAGWYLYGEEEAPIAGGASKSRVDGKARNAADVRRLLRKIDGLTPGNITVLLSAIEGFQRVNTGQSSQSRQEDRSASETPRR